MIKLKRPPKPKALAKDKHWTGLHLRKLANNPSYSFQWPRWKGRESLSVPVRAALEAMTQNHCSYCDGFPLGPLSPQTIDHFRPRSQFPRRVFEWPNLFLACWRCQQEKGKQFDERLLKPDHRKYEFGYYFHYSVFTGVLEVNHDAPEEFQEHAEFTLCTLNLNAPELRSDRKRWFRIYYKGGIALNEAPYRFIYGA